MTDHRPGGLLRAIVGTLEAIGIPYMVVGSFASTAYGEPRSTRDLDLVIDPSPDQLNQLLAALDPRELASSPSRSLPPIVAGVMPPVLVDLVRYRSSPSSRATSVACTRRAGSRRTRS
jgi:hypothetical protein